MIGLCLTLIAAAFVAAAPATWIIREISTRAGALDSPGVRGQVKAAARRVPNTGGIGIVAAFVLPLAAGLAILNIEAGAAWAIRTVPGLAPHLHGIRERTADAWIVIACVLGLHVVGLIDDRRPLGPGVKLGAMLIAAGFAAWATDSRLLTLLDAKAGGAWLSLAITVVWIVVITNAFNFLDNMDGLSGGVAAICASVFLGATLAQPAPQWFIAAALALLIGALLGFLLFNFPFGRGKGERGATIFMGDGGSLVIGFVIALMSVRITYLPPTSIGDAGLARAHMLLAPLVILAIPLYDFCSVVAIRLSQGRSPFVGDLQHFSHRLVRHGLSKRDAVLVIYGATIATGIGAIMLPRLAWREGLLVGVQTLAILGVIALYEWSRPDPEGRGSGAKP